MTQSTALVTVVSGAAYFDFAEAMFESAREHFHPTENVVFETLPGHAGWPAATMYRPHVLRDNMPRTNFVFMIDADAVIEQPVGSEILPPRGLGVTATLHPGYVEQAVDVLPYERNPESAAYMEPGAGSAYYCGGLIGGERLAVRIHMSRVAQVIDIDQARGYTPIWHDESAANRVLWSYPPDRELDPSYAHPDNDRYYRDHVWKKDYDRKIVMLDKTSEVRGLR